MNTILIKLHITQVDEPAWMREAYLPSELHGTYDLTADGRWGVTAGW